MANASLTDAQRRFAIAAVKRRSLFLWLSAIGVLAGLALTVYYAVRWLQDPAYPIGLRAALVVLILLNARQNLRQFRYASVLSPLIREE